MPLRSAVCNNLPLERTEGSQHSAEGGRFQPMTNETNSGSSPTAILTFAVAANNREMLEANFLASPCFQTGHPHQILVQEGYPSASKAYNDAIEKSRNDLIIFAHQDVIFPDEWLAQLEKALRYLEINDPDWGVLGCYGRTLDQGAHGYVYSPGPGFIGAPFENPAKVQTLDEIVLILRKSSGLRFDDTLPNFHLYGTDICMRASKLGRRSYAIPALCVHNSLHYLVLPDEFYACYKHVRRVWKASLPIQTPCIRITASNKFLYERRLREFYLRHIRHRTVIADRAKDGRNLLDALRRMTASSSELS
jgi:hypothetical protein